MNIEIDLQPIIAEVTKQLVHNAAYEMRLQVEKELKLQITAVVRQQARDYAKQMLEEFIFPEDGRTFNQYLHDKFTKPSVHNEKPLFETQITRVVESLSRTWLAELFEEQLPVIREQVVARLLSLAEEKLKGR